MSKYYFPKGKMVIQGHWVMWFKNNRGRGRLLKAGQGVVDSLEFAQETYHDFNQRNQLGQ